MGLLLRSGNLSGYPVHRLPGCRARAWADEDADQHDERRDVRADAAPVPLSADHSGAAVSTALFRACQPGRVGVDDHRRKRADGRVDGRCDQPAGLAGRADDHDPVLSFPAKPVVRAGCRCADPASGLADPAHAAPDQPAQQEAYPGGARSRRADRRKRGRRGDAAIQCRLALADVDDQLSAGAAVQHPLRYLPEKVFHEVREQLHRAVDSLPVLFDRRLSGVAGQRVTGGAGGGACSVQGFVEPLERVADLLQSDTGHVAALGGDPGPVRAAGYDRRRQVQRFPRRAPAPDRRYRARQGFGP